MQRQPTKQERQWNKQLSYHLERYGLIREWSDLANWLSKLKQILGELKQGMIIMQRDSLFKRLASCLNVTLPIALQQQTLQCYDYIMNSQLTVQSLPLLCVGLFPFFQSATVRVKQKTLDLFKQHLVKVGTELGPLMSGLISAILPGLLEMNEPLQKNIMGLLDFYSQLLGPEIVIASIWSAMLRSSHCRIAGLRYLAAKLISQGKGIEENQLNDSQDQDVDPSNVDSIVQERRELKMQIDSQIDYMPYKNTLVLNTLVACLEDTNTLVIKSALDFLYKYLSLRSEQQILNKEEQSKLIDSVILLLMKRDVSTTRKINIWLFGKPDQDNKYNITPSNQSVVGLIIESLLRHFKDPTKQQSLAPLKIILNIYSEHQHLIQRTLPSLSEPLLEFMFNVYKKQQSNKQSLLEGMKISQRVMNHIGSQKMIILISLGNKLLQNVDPVNQKEWLRHLELIQFFQQKLLKQDEAKENKQLLFRILIMLIVTFQNVIKSRKCLIAGLNLGVNVIKKLISQPRTAEDLKAFQTSVEAYQNYFRALINIIKTEPYYQKQYQTSIHLMIHIYKLIGNKQNHDWIELLCQSIMYQGYFLSSTEGIVKILQLGSSDPVYKPLKQKIVTLSDTKNSYIEQAINILYEQLSNPNSQTKTISLLLRLSKQFPKLLNDVVSSSFARYSQSHQQIAITKFALFWRLSGRNKELISWRELNELNKLGLFSILDYLDHQNPLVKHTTKQWITESLVDFNRVLDPLLQVLVPAHSTFYKTYQGQLLYSKSFEVNRCVDILKKLKQILLQTTDNSLSFIMKPISQSTKTMYDRFSNTFNQGNYPTYLEFIFKVMVKYLQGKFVLANGPCSLSLIACQLLQIIITTIDDPKTCYALLKPYIKQILQCLHFSILNSQNVSQVQLINLLKSILFNSSLRKSPNDGDIKTFLKELVGSKLLIQSLVRGLDNESIYIKQKYVEFIILSIPLFLEYHPNATSLICHILNVLTSKIVVINAKSQGNNSYLKQQILVILEGVKSMMSYFLDLKIKPFEKQKTQNDTDNGLFSLNSWKSFVSLGLNTNNNQTKPKKNQDIVKQILNDLYQTILTITQCWNISELKDLYKVTRTGIQHYQSDKFLIFNKQLYSMIGLMQTNDSLENYIIRLVRVIFNNYPHQTLNCFVLNWCSNSSQNSRLKILEILIFMGLPVEMFYQIIVETQTVDRLAKADKKRTSKTPMTIERGSQTSILLMCQAFTHYSHQSFNIFQSQHILTLWNAFFKFIKMFLNSTNVLIVYHILELFHLFIQKFNPKQLLKDQKFKRELQTIFNEILILVQVATGRSKFTIGQKFGFKFQELLPLPASLYEIYKKQITKVDEVKMACLCFNQSQGDEKGWEFTRLHCFMVLRKLAYEILLNLFTESEIVLAKKLRQLLILIFPVVEDKSLENMLFAEKSSEIICYIMEQKQVFLRQFRNDLLQIFNKDDFFICTRKTLQQWARIVDLVIDNNKQLDIFLDYLSKVPSASSFFSKQTTQTKKKIKSFERICFILYSGTKDKYTGKLQALLQKIVDVIKGTQTSQPVLILILFCIRIVILRTSNDALTKLLADLWPRILFVLIGIFHKQPDNKPGTINLVWAALKLIELVSITEMSSFNTHQWIFFHDFVNVQLAGSSDEASLKGQPNGYGHRPLVQKWFPKDIRGFFTDSTPVSHENQRRIIIKQDKIDDMQLLKAKSLALSQYMIINNSSKSKMDIKQLQDIIQGDFLSLDEFIYKVS